MPKILHTTCLLVLMAAGNAFSQWLVLPPTDERNSLPASVPADAKPIKPGDKWRTTTSTAGSSAIWLFRHRSTINRAAGSWA